ncbi:class I SAM-dependent methyltransferase [Pedobacter sp. MC2016-14]|uniref:class I SAM-dependent methyltransferase n=1 Tax=Pedobacter sp. MC2016-14 TaxID=2897327 RepID=UPI001E2943DB|nr:class I SAM-dependent methyltransferase [Pedobacter sp. MC2016-14]MCD0488742.1 class I SAM-dependent methyltransferase [Pedobacter sp. MC2016-14]
MKLNNYDKIAKYYDFLSRMVFFKSQVNAQKQQLALVPANSKVLIVGGGTGWILDEIAKLHPQGLEIIYVEISANMLELAKKRKYGNNSLEFVHLPIEEFVEQQSFDVILTAFLFDNFAKDRVKQVFSKLNYLLKPGGLWLFTDFVQQPRQSKIWQSLLLKTMYLFFRKLSNVEASHLIDTGAEFKQCGYLKLEEKDYYRGFIKSIVYKKAV